MAIPYYTHSGMAGAPQFSTAARSTPDILAAVLVNGFNVQAPTSAVASGGVLTLNFGSAHGYEALCHITVSGASVSAANGTWRVATVPAGNQLTCTIAGLPDGAVGGTISTKVAGAGWTEPFAPDATTRVFRMPGGNQRYLRVRQAGGFTSGGARCYEDMTGLDAGTGPFPTVAQQSGNGSWLFGPGSLVSGNSWWAVASPTGFIAANLGSSPAGSLAVFDLLSPVKAGDFYHTAMFDAPATGYLARSHTAAAGAVTCGLALIQQSLTSPSPISGGQRFFYGSPVVAGGAVRGLVPGAFQVLPAVGSASGATYSDIENIDGRVRLLYSDGSGSSAIAIALDEDWPEA